jgi:hypothetical protein
VPIDQGVELGDVLVAEAVVFDDNSGEFSVCNGTGRASSVLGGGGQGCLTGGGVVQPNKATRRMPAATQAGSIDNQSSSCSLPGPTGLGKLFGNFVSTLYLFLVLSRVGQGLLKLLDPMPLISRRSPAPISVHSHKANTNGKSKQAIR